MKWRSGEGFSSRIYTVWIRNLGNTHRQIEVHVCHKSKAMIVRFNLTLLYISIISLHFSDP